MFLGLRWTGGSGLFGTCRGIRDRTRRFGLDVGFRAAGPTAFTRQELNTHAKKNDKSTRSVVRTEGSDDASTGNETATDEKATGRSRRTVCGSFVFSSRRLHGEYSLYADKRNILLRV